MSFSLDASWWLTSDGDCSVVCRSCRWHQRMRSAGACVALWLAPACLLAARPDARLDAVRRLLADAPLVDGHNDLPWNIRKFLKNQLRDFPFHEDLRSVPPWSHSAWSHTDLPRLRQGMVAAQFWSAYVPCSAQHLDAVTLVLEQVDVIRRLVERYPRDLALVTSARGIEEAHAAGVLACLVGVEGGHALGSSLAVLRGLHALGARYLTLTHACNTPWADCSIVDEPGRIPILGGLSSFGKLVVREMNRLGVMVDVSHASVPTMLDALRTSRAPVIFSHSAAHALCNSSRNVPDHVLRLLAANGGIVMVAFYPHFVSCSESASLQDVAAHIEHIRSVAGIDHVGLGAGYDGINITPLGLEDASRYPHLLAELMARGGWTEGDLQKLAGRNLIRVFREAERVRDQMAASGVQPLDERIPEEDVRGRTYCRMPDAAPTGCELRRGARELPYG
ncbi:dipeptidase 1-like [Schistocerca gregaria]|uniref:dipeptidase 1-like n=1 Tax=Schistocerca gregaria TaxID=7010 RepID=UPI00211EB8CC|nr:dipeptidase 1-like [Schistocerca gregaria]